MLHIRAVTIESFLKQRELHYTRTIMPENVKNIWTPPTPLNYWPEFVQKTDYAIHRINQCTMPLHFLLALDSVVCFPNDYKMDSDLSSALRYHEQLIKTTKTQQIN